MEYEIWIATKRLIVFVSILYDIDVRVITENRITGWEQWASYVRG